MTSKMIKTNLLEITREQLVAWLTDRKIAAYRANQIQKWIYLRQTDSFDNMTDLSKDIRALLKEFFMIGRLETERVETSRDGSCKYLFKLNDGKRIERRLLAVVRFSNSSESRRSR